MFFNSNSDILHSYRYRKKGEDESGDDSTSDDEKEDDDHLGEITGDNEPAGENV